MTNGASIVCDHEIRQLPRVLKGFDFKFFLLLVHSQFASRQQSAGTLTIGAEIQLYNPDVVVPGPWRVIKFPPLQPPICDQTQSPSGLGGQFHNVLDVISYATTGESDTSLGAHVLEFAHQAVLTVTLEGIDQCLPIVLRGISLDINVDVIKLAQLRARPHDGGLDCHAPLRLSACVEAR